MICHGDGCSGVVVSVVMVVVLKDVLPHFLVSFGDIFLSFALTLALKKFLPQFGRVVMLVNLILILVLLAHLKVIFTTKPITVIIPDRSSINGFVILIRTRSI